MWRAPGSGLVVVASRVQAAAAWAMTLATVSGRDTYTAWLAATSVTVEPARSAMARWVSS